MRRRRRARTKDAPETAKVSKKKAPTKKKTSKSPSTASGRKMWVRTDDGKVLWVDGTEGGSLPTPDEIRAAERERTREAAEKRERERRAKQPIRFKCPHCKIRIAAPRSKCGEKIACKCGMKMLVPDPPDAPKERIAIECMTCGKPHLPSIERCDSCGDMLPAEKSCSSCGQMWLRRSVCFCPRCGLELDDV